MIVSLIMGDFMFKNYLKRVADAVVILLVCVIAMPVFLTGCGFFSKDDKKVSEMDYTVVEDADLPVELKKLIDEKKESTLRLTYTTKDYTYVVAGYGKQPSSGYSIKVNDVYLGQNAIIVNVELVGPAASESVTQMPTTPYIVLKMEKRDEAVVFKL